MIFVLRYFFVICLFGLGIIGFNIYVNIHVYAQLLKNFICKDLDEPLASYDYIIVGSGTAGSIVALRLAQEKKNKILLLEAGPYSNFLFDVPAMGSMLQKTDFDWQHETVPQKYACRAMKNNISYWPMGRIFGGTHRLNNMIHVRGHAEDYQEWFKDKTDYNYDQDILYYFKKAENWLNTKYNSPLLLNNLEFVSSLAESILDAAESLGYPVKNINSHPGIGFMKPYVTTKNGKRWTTSHSLLEENPQNLKILTSAHVSKIIFKNNYEASAVQFSYLGDKRVVKARKGVILSAGVIGTPKLLLLSGVGPQNHLTKVKIRTRKNLPVGQNLFDHITTGLDLIILNKTLSVNIESLVSPFSAYQYFVYGQGPWVTVGCEAIGFCHTRINQLEVQPDLQFMVIAGGVSSDAGKHFKNALGVKPEIWTNYFSHLVGKQVASIIPIVLHPKSRGTVKLKSSDPDAPVEINPNYLSDQNDVDILLEGIKIIKKIVQSESMQKLGARINSEVFPGCENFEFDSKNYWECYIRHLSLTSFHPGGTCKIGDPSDSNTVVDFNFQVVGMNKLFIVDASVFPSLTSGNLNSAVAMMAEKAADLIKYLNFLLIGKCRKIDILLRDDLCIL